MKIRAVIFDLDGVIVSTDQFHYQAWKKIADKLGIGFDERINDKLRGVSRTESLELILEQDKSVSLSRKEKETLARQKNEEYRKLLQQLTPSHVSPEVKKTLEILRERGYKTAIGSSSKNTLFILEKIGLFSAFDAIADGTNITKSKPDPEVFLKAAELLWELPEHCLVVEDAEAGIQAAKSAGMKAAAVGAAISCEQADYRWNNIVELLNVLP